MGIWVNKSIIDKLWSKIDDVFLRKTASEKIQESVGNAMDGLSKKIDDGDKALDDKIAKTNQSIDNLDKSKSEEIADAVAETLYEVSEHLIPRYSNVPTALHLNYLDEISIRNKAELFIGARITPAPELQNIVFQKKSGTSLNIHPTTGKLEILELGESSFYIYPTFNTRICKEVSITVRRIRLMVNGSVIRLDGKNIRTT